MSGIICKGSIAVILAQFQRMAALDWIADVSNGISAAIRIESKFDWIECFLTDDMTLSLGKEIYGEFPSLRAIRSTQ